MQKIDLYNLYVNNPKLKKQITDNLKCIMTFDSLTGELFSVCCNLNKYKLSKKVFKSLVELYEVIGYSENDNIKIEFHNRINRILENDYLTSICEFNEILYVVNIFLNLSIYEIVSDSNNYETSKIELLDYFIGYLEKTNNKDKYLLYDKDIKTITNSIIDLLEDLPNTEYSYEEDFEQNCFNRVKTYFEVLSNEKIACLNEDKYNTIVKSLALITNINEMEKFEKRVIKIPKKISDIEFKLYTERLTKNFNNNTLDLINSEVDFKKDYLKKLKKILCTEEQKKNGNIIKF